jgi:hypothetical protein
MGDDFMERYYRQISRGISKNFERQFNSRDLFSGIAPALVSEVVGFVVPGMNLSPGQLLVRLPQRPGAEGFVLCSGARRAVELFGESAAHAAQSRVVSAEVVSVSPEEGCVALRFHSRYPSKN